MTGARVEVCLPVIRGNCRILREHLPHHVALCGVVKADGYGHGIVEAAGAMVAGGADCVSVAHAGEGIDLRASGFTERILVLAPAEDEETEAAVRAGLELTVFAREHIENIRRAALASAVRARVHIKIDSGMNRLGAANLAQVRALIKALERAPEITAVAAFSHLARADEPAPDAAFAQLARFRALAVPLDAAGIAPIRHIANSAAALREPALHLDMVRPGIALYGCAPSPGVPLPDGMRPAMCWAAPVERVEHVSEGEGIGYGARFVAPRAMRVATVAVGYGDGYHRTVNRGCVLIGGQRAPILGAVCMDHLMADVSAIERPGGEAVLLGAQGSDVLTLEEVAEAWDTIPYEVMLAPLPRMRRVYVEEL